jgi:microcompartment protein CcmL/EutN
MFVNRRKDMSKLSLGIIETVGLAAAIEAADVCVKSANVKLVGYELSKGDGMTVVKIVGNVGAVNAAISAAEMAASWVSAVISCRVIARPSDQLGIMIENGETVGLEKCPEEEIEEVEAIETIEEDKEIKTAEKLEITEEDKVEETLSTEETFPEVKKLKFTCNICKDPECTRKKGDLRRECIHYKEKN